MQSALFRINLSRIFVPSSWCKTLWVSEIIQFTLLLHHQCCSQTLPDKHEQNGLQLHANSNIHLWGQLSPLSLCTAQIQPEAEASAVTFQNLLLTDVFEAIKAFDWGRCLHTPVSKWFSAFKAKWGNSLPPSKNQLLLQPGKTSVHSQSHSVWWCSPLACCVWNAHIDFYLALWLNFNQRILTQNFSSVREKSEPYL